MMVYDLCAAWIAAITLSSACSKMAEALLVDSATCFSNLSYMEWSEREEVIIP